MLASVLSTFGKALRFVWLFIGACILAIVLAEAALQLGYAAVDAASFALHHRKPRARTPCERVMGSLKLRWQPYTYWRGEPSHNDLVTVDADGRRHTWEPARPDPAAPLVAVTGGSAVWGMCVPDDETIPSWLARRLADSGTPARVENHAQIGWVTTQSLVDLMLDLRAGRVPRVAVFYDGWNDIVAGLTEGEPGSPLNEARRRTEFNLLTDLWKMRLYSLGDPMNSAMGRLANTIRRRLFKAPRPGGVSPGWRAAYGADTSDARLDSVAREVVRVYEWNVSTVEQLARTYGFRPLFYWQPDIVGKRVLSATERASLAENPLMVRLAGRVHAAVQASPALRADAGFRDLQAMFDDDEQGIFFDWCHVSPGANERVADVIAEDVRRALAAPAVPAARTGGVAIDAARR